MRSFYAIALNRLSTSRHCEIRIYDIVKFYKKLYHNRGTVIFSHGTIYTLCSSNF